MNILCCDSLKPMSGLCQAMPWYNRASSLVFGAKKVLYFLNVSLHFKSILSRNMYDLGKIYTIKMGKWNETACSFLDFKVTKISPNKQM